MAAPTASGARWVFAERAGGAHRTAARANTAWVSGAVLRRFFDGRVALMAVPGNPEGNPVYGQGRMWRARHCRRPFHGVKAMLAKSLNKGVD